jgi:hypothetical protein
MVIANDEDTAPSDGDILYSMARETSTREVGWPRFGRPRGSLRKRCVVQVTPWTALLCAGFILVIVVLYFGIRSQMRRGETLAGPIEPDKLLGSEPEPFKGDESEMEQHVEEWTTEGKDLGHG